MQRINWEICAEVEFLRFFSFSHNSQEIDCFGVLLEVLFMIAFKDKFKSKLILYKVKECLLVPKIDITLTTLTDILCAHSRRLIFQKCLG